MQQEGKNIGVQPARGSEEGGRSSRPNGEARFSKRNVLDIKDNEGSSPRQTKKEPWQKRTRGRTYFGKSGRKMSEEQDGKRILWRSKKDINRKCCKKNKLRVGEETMDGQAQCTSSPKGGKGIPTSGWMSATLVRGVKSQRQNKQEEKIETECIKNMKLEEHSSRGKVKPE